MKGSFILYFLLALAPHIIYAVDESCKYDYICTTDVVPEVVADEDECQTNCAAKPAAECSDWTFKILHEQNLCFHLTHCDSKDPMCQVPQSCSSGPRECPTAASCDALTYPGSPTSDTKLWSCWEEPAPYSNPIPVGTHCQIQCPTFVDSGSETPHPGVITAQCTGDKTWTADAPVTTADGTLVISPDTAPGPECKCTPIVIPADTLESGENGKGAELYIDGKLATNDGVEIKIESGMNAVLLCDRYPVMDFSCMGGEWNDASLGPVTDCKDIYCYNAPTSCESSPDPVTDAP